MTDQPNSLEHRLTIALSHSGQRLDQVCQQLFPEYSRARLQQWIKEGALTINGQLVKPKTKLRGGEALLLQAEPEEQGDWLPEPMAMDTVYEDDALLVLNKPADLVVHPAAGNYSGTLLNGLIHYAPALKQIPRAGIVHRLDKDTTGLMVVAKTLACQTSLVQQLQARQVSRSYCAVVHGICPSSGIVEGNIGRDPSNRKKMAVVANGGKEARTHFKRLQAFRGFSLVHLKLETGRTHQIRVHMAKLGYPLLGDPLYGKRLPKKADVEVELRAALESFPRQALHAYALKLSHPETGNDIGWFAGPPIDINDLLKALDSTWEDQRTLELLRGAASEAS